MKKLFVILFCMGLVIGGCRNKREEERRRLEIERIRQDQEAARLADEQRLLELQLRTQQDSVARPKQTARRAYYVVIGSFRVSGNAYSYSSSMQSIFSNVSVVQRRGWHYVTVGGPFSSRYGARRMLQTVLSTGGIAPPVSMSEDISMDEEEDEEDYSDEEESEEEVDDEGGDEEYTEEEEDEESEVDMEEEEEYEEAVPISAPVSTGFGGQAWVMAL